jgi:hypothetical protein
MFEKNFGLFLASFQRRVLPFNKKKISIAVSEK